PHFSVFLVEAYTLWQHVHWKCFRLGRLRFSGLFIGVHLVERNTKTFFYSRAVLTAHTSVYGQLRTRFCGSVFSGNCKVGGDRFLGQHTSGAFHIPTPTQVRLVGADLTEYIELLLPRLRVRRSSFSGPVGLAGEVVHSKVRSQDRKSVV